MAVEQDNFLNGCIEIETLYSPEELLKKSANRSTEGRTKKYTGVKNIGYRHCFYENQIVDLPELKIPHVEMHKRIFV